MVVELESEVEAWLRGLSSDEEFGAAAFYIDLLEERGFHLPFPYSPQLRRGDLRELSTRDGPGSGSPTSSPDGASSS